MFRLIDRLVVSMVLMLATTGCPQSPDSASQLTPPPLASESLTSADPVREDRLPTFKEWKNQCDRLPLNRELNGRYPPVSLLPLKSFQDFEKVLDNYLDYSRTSQLSNREKWVGNIDKLNAFLNTKSAYFLKNSEIPFQTYTEKRTVPPGTEILIHGDLHGDIRSFLTYLEWLNANSFLDDFRLTKPGSMMVFLGDFVDRGVYGVEVLYTLFRLVIANPERIVLLRGNHEDFGMTMRYGFLEEGRRKYGKANFKEIKTWRAFDFFASAFYLGCGKDFLLCCHGGMEPAFDPRSLLAASGEQRFQFLGTLNQKTFADDHPEMLRTLSPQQRSSVKSELRDFVPMGPSYPASIGFIWNDFTLLKDEPALYYNPGRGFVYGLYATQYLLDLFEIDGFRTRGVFRAHQHSSVINPMMRRLVASKGVYRHWQSTDSVGLLNADPVVLQTRLESSETRKLTPGSVWTFNVAPDSTYGAGSNFGFDSFVVLKTAEKFEEWTMTVRNVDVVH